ncbi:DMT family transporter [Aestuariispira insulae]|nr:EamA family transporter [Aestuariispira insulae]
MTDHKLEYGLLGLLALLWGSSYLFIGLAVDEIPPVTLVAVRVSGAACFLLIVLFLRGLRLPRDRRDWARLLLQSFFNSIGAWLLLVWGQQYVDSALASVLNSTSPIFVVLIGSMLALSDRPAIRKILGAALGLAGVALIVGFGALNGLGEQVWAQLAILGGAALYGCAALYGRRLSHLPSAVSAAGVMIWATIALVPASLILERPWTLSPSLGAMAAAGFLSIGCTGVALLIYYRLVHTLGPLGVASQAYLRAGVGVVLGMLFLGETITAEQGIGLAAALIGVMLINSRGNWFRSKRAPIGSD